MGDLPNVFIISKRLNYVNHARRLADGDWTGADSDGEEDMEKKEDGEQDDHTEEEGMEIERRKLPKHYANQVSVSCHITIKLLFLCEGQHIRASRGRTSFYSVSLSSRCGWILC